MFRLSSRRSYFLSIAILLGGAFTFMSCKKEKARFESLGLPEECRQLIWVNTDSWESPSGSMTLWEWEDEQWITNGDSIDVMVGRNGLGWGQGIHEPLTGIQKKEGDGKAPAGIFEVGDLFGYAVSAPVGAKMNYRPITDRDYFVDDASSEDYNLWQTIPVQEENQPDSLWKSFEYMYRLDSLYELGFMVMHNSNPVVQGKGSAIFYHIWRGPGSPTAGCTSMTKENIEKLMKWLDPAKRPLIVQVPVGELGDLKVRSSD